MLDVTLPIAFIFGLISFVSPCVLPLVPAYISYLGGRMVYAADAGAVGQAVAVGSVGQAVAPRGLSMRFGLLLHGLAFVMGFTIVFVLLGILTSVFIQQLGGLNISSVIGIISRLGGVLIIFFGLHFSGILPDLFRRVRAIADGRVHALIVGVLALLGSAILIWGFAGRLALWMPAYGGTLDTVPLWPDVLALASVALFLLLLVLGGAFTNSRAFVVRLTNTVEMALYADTRRQMEQDQTGGLFGSLLMGIIFSAGWSPCIGTIYGSILTISAQTGDVARTSMQLAAYSFGLGIPFLLAAVALDSVQGIFRRLNKRMKTIKLVSGLLLILIGLLVASGELQRVTLQLSTGELAELSLELEDRALEALVGPQE
jgi:cytochrome c-type biogenesis protein